MPYTENVSQPELMKPGDPRNDKLKADTVTHDSVSTALFMHFPFPTVMLKRNIEGPIGGKAPDAMLINPVVRIAPPQDMRLASTPS
jgi:hypothetical protein